jgi:hypothetical protein
MLGHEGVRRLTEAHLIELLPGFLAEVRAQVPPVDVDNEPAVWPPDPHVMCADEFPDRSDKLPSVIVTSAELLGMKAEEGGACTEWTCTYQLDLGVLVVSPQSGQLTLASIGRDRVLLALRHICLRRPDVTGTVSIDARQLTEETGPGKQDSASRPLAAGLITVRIVAVETLDEISFPISTITTDVTAVDAAQTLPTTS